MKNMLVLAVLTSSMMVAAPAVSVAPKANVVARAYKAVAGSIASAASYTATKAVNGAQAVRSAAGSVATTVKANATKAVVVVKAHPKTAVAVTAVAGIAVLYNTNEAFRNKVRSLLGLDKTEVQNA